MKTYTVGGAVRDELLGLPVQDRDYVVVGSTPEEMTAAGFRPVGKDFPVFLHPQTHEEYALARTERKSGRGYKGFTVYAAPDVTLEQDLARRDLTINAIAKSDDGGYIDPFEGRKDLKAGVLRHVGEAFEEDPVRILRVARFAARFGFRIADETLALMKKMVDSGEADHLVAERVWQEFAKGLAEPKPGLMFEALERCGLRPKLLPELKSIPKNFDGPLPVRFAVLCWPLTEAEIKALCDRIKVPNDERELALLAFRTPKLLDAAQPGELLNLLKRADAFRRPERFALLLQAAAIAKVDFHQEKILKALAAAEAVDADEIARKASAPAAISALLDQAREQAIASAFDVFKKRKVMIDLHTWSTPNGRKVSVMLEECGIPYRVHTVNIGKDEQFRPEFLAINPNNRIPAIVDPDGPEGKPLPLFESGAILVYLSAKAGGRFLPANDRGKWIALQWLMFQMGGVGPMFGQAHHFMRAKKDEIPYGTQRYGNEAKRLYGVLDKRLSEAAYLADEYSIADIATYPWVARHEWHRVDLAAYPNVKRWYDTIGRRPAVVRGMAVPAA